MSKAILKKLFSFSLIFVLGITLLAPLPGETKASDTTPYEERVAKLKGSDWMSLISDDRQLNEINIPGSHDAAMWNPKHSGFLGLFTTKYAKTQGQTINEQMLFGNRIFDVRMASKIDVDKEQNDAYCVHGKKENAFLDFRFYNIKRTGFWSGDEYYMVSDVLNDMSVFLQAHPTETILLELGYESDSSDEDATYSRAQNLLNQYRDKINPATGKPFIYTQNGSQKITSMPKMGDVRGQIVILSKNTAKLGYGIQYSAGNGYTSADVAGVPFTFENHYEADRTHKWDYVNAFYGLSDKRTIEAWPADDDTKAYQKEEIAPSNDGIPKDVTYHTNKGHIICTSSNVAWAGWKKLGDSPKDVADYVNPKFYTDTFISRGTLYGWIYSDFTTAEYAKLIYLANFPVGDNSLHYRTVTYQKGDTATGNDDLSFALAGEKITVKDIKPDTKSNKTFIGWKIEGDNTGKLYKTGDTLTVNADIKFVPAYEMSWSDLNKSISHLPNGSSETYALGTELKANASDDTIKIPSGVNVTINLNNNDIDANANSLKNRTCFTVYGKLTISGSGTIKNALGKKGGAFYVAPGGELTINEDVTVSNNKAEFGGGIYLAEGTPQSQSKVNINGAKIKNNLANSLVGYGGGIYASKNSLVYLSGTPIISENKKSVYVGETPNNVHIDKDNNTPVLIKSDFRTSGSSIGISYSEKAITQSSDGAIDFAAMQDVTVISDAIKNCFKSDNSRYNIDKGADNKTLRLVAKYTLTFMNGATKYATKSVAYKQKITELPILPKEQGKVFAGWYADAECTTSYDFNKPVTESATLYAKWVDEVGTFVVIFHTNGGSNVNPQNIISGNKASKPSPDPTRSGYTFTGWYKEPDCNTTYTFNETVNSNTTIYAGWKKAERTVTFNYNGGTGSETTQNVTDGDTATWPDDPTRNGYIFDGWYEDLDCTKPYDFDKPVTSDITLTAGWEEAAPYTVTFDSNGGSAVDSVIVQETDVVLDINDKTPTYPYHNFVGWYTKIEELKPDEAQAMIQKDPELKDYIWIDGNNVYLLVEDNWLIVDDNYDLRARWEAGYCTVSFRDEKNNKIDEPEKVKYGSKLTRPSDPVGVGWEFVDWYADRNCTNKFNFDNTITGDITIYAKSKPASYTVSFDTVGGTKVDSQKVQYNQHATRPASNPTRTGYDFKGWGEYITNDADTAKAIMDYEYETGFDKSKFVYIDGNLYYQYDFASEVVEDNMTLTAIWQRNSDPTPAPTPGVVSDVTDVLSNEGQTQFADTVEELAQKVLTDEEKELVQQGSSASVWIEAEDNYSSVSEEEKELVNKYIFNRFYIGKYLNLSLWTQIENHIAKLVSYVPNGSVRIRTSVPVNLRKPGRNYDVIAIHDGVVYDLDCTYYSDLEMLEFETDRFSTYVIVYNDSTESGDNTEWTESGDNTEWTTSKEVIDTRTDAEVKGVNKKVSPPQTKDEIFKICFVLFVVFLSMICMIVRVRKK